MSKITIDAKAFLKALQGAAPAIASNPVLPITEGFRLVATDETLEVTATDMGTTITVPVPCKGEISCVVPKLIMDTMKLLDGDVTLELAEKLVIKAKSGRYSMPVFNVADFPTIQFPTEFEYVGDIQGLVESTAWTASTDELRPVMCGVLWEQSETGLNIVATDAHKLAKYTTEVKGTNRVMVVPKKAIQRLQGEVSVASDERMAHFLLPDKKVSTVLVDGKYPNYEAVIPKENPFKVTAELSEVIAALKSVAIYANKTTNLVVIDVSGDVMKFTALDLDQQQEAEFQVQCKSTMDLKFGMNARFLLEALSKCDEFEMYGSAPNRAFILKTEGIILLMPVNTEQ